MPYIKKPCRAPFGGGIEELRNALRAAGHKAGDLNYVITRIVDDWLGSVPRYDDFNAAMGVLSCVAQELYRRRIALYEDQKCATNGDVFMYQFD